MMCNVWMYKCILCTDMGDAGCDIDFLYAVRLTCV